MTQATKRPWEAYSYSSPRKVRKYWALGNIDRGKCGIATWMTEEDAKYVAKAVNERDELINLLKECAHAIDIAIYNEDGLDGDAGELLIRRITEALSKSEAL